MLKINIDDRYPSEGEIRVSDKPYIDYGECLLKTFKNVESFCDVGCATGHLMSYLKDKTNCKTKGYEYFKYHKESEHCKSNIKDDIEIYDIRDPLPDGIEKYEVVNCSEVGEHIDPDYTDILIENAKKLSSKYVIFTWSSHGGEYEKHCDPLHQHLNPLNRMAYIRLMKKHGLKENKKLTRTFLRESNHKKDFYFWWRESFIIWEI